MNVGVFAKHKKNSWSHFVEPKLLLLCTERPEILCHYPSAKEAEFREGIFLTKIGETLQVKKDWPQNDRKQINNRCKSLPCKSTPENENEK